MYLKRIRKRNTVEQHKAVSLRSQIVTPDNNRILLKIKSLLFNFSPPPLLEFMEIVYCINHNVR